MVRMLNTSLKRVIFPSSSCQSQDCRNETLGNNVHRSVCNEFQARSSVCGARETFYCVRSW